MDNIPMKFKFGMRDEFGQEYKYDSKVYKYDDDMDELDFILEQFKSFLKASGYSELTTSRIQYLEPDEWKHVLTSYGEWDDEKERCYDIWIKN